MTAYTDSPADRERVRARIGGVLVDLWRAGLGREFHGADLVRAVEAQVGTVAGGSPDRILRALRADRQLHYTLVSRRASLYRWEPVPPLPVYREPVQASLLEGLA